MPPNLKLSSTERRHSQADRIDRLGKTMVRSCTRCREAKLVCRAHISSGRCGACTKANVRGCDVRVTEGEWTRLKERRRVLEQKREQNRVIVVRKQEELAQRMEELQKAQTELSAAWSKEGRLQKEMDLLERGEAEAIAVESAELEELDPPAESGFFLQPSTWSAQDGILDDFWSDPSFLNVPDLLVPGDTSGGVSRP